MFRLLIVEDNASTVDTLKMNLNITFSRKHTDGSTLKPHIDVADTVDKAMQFINNTKTSPYDAVILDFKLPKKNIGEHPEVDKSLCAAISRNMHSTVVAHITAYPEDDAVKEHNKKFHLERIDNGFVLSKLDTTYVDKLLKELKAFLYGKPIKEKIEQLFKNAQLRFDPQTTPLQGRGRGARGLTHDLASLRRNIVAHWDDLDEGLKKLIRDTFKLDESNRPIRISLL